MKPEEMNELILALTGVDVNKSIEERICPSCKNPVGEFRDKLSDGIK